MQLLTDKEERFFRNMQVAIILFTVVGTILWVWFGAMQEAKSYNKFCDTQVETWDAVWLDLRIDECE